MEATDKEKSLLAQRYEVVNAAWPASTLPSLTAAEARTAALRLYRFGFALYDQKRSFRGEVRITSGNRSTWVRGKRASQMTESRFIPARTTAVFMVNPAKGWHDLVHDISHFIHSRCTNESAHRDGHAFVERKMIEHVVASGWLDGKLKRPEKPKAARNVKAENYARAVAKLKRWQSKAKLAQTKVKKLRTTVHRYERQMNTGTTTEVAT